MNQNKTRRQALMLFAAALPLAACDSVLPGQGPAPNFYRPTPKNTFPKDLPKVDWQLVISEPEADASLETSRIALMQLPTSVEYYAESAWTDLAPKMVQTLLLESFENSKAIIAVGRRALGLRADFELKTELRDFQAEYFGAEKVVRVAINAKLVQLPRREIVGSENFSWTVAFAEDAMPAIIQAFDDALGHVLKRLVTWTLQTGAQYYTPPS